jgi:CYTH domain-containing protein
MKQKYARIERERRFLLDGFPEAVEATEVRRIRDRYLDGTRLRLREQTEERGGRIFKLAHKTPWRGAGGQQGWITNLYLSEEEFGVLAQLAGKELSKTRYSAPPLGIDVFEGVLAGLVMAEVEVESAEEAEVFEPPTFVGPEVTEDERFTGGALVRATRRDLEGWLAEYQISSG